MPVDVQPGDIATLRKPHPCGSYQWLVVRIGADIGLRCQSCQRKIMLPRHEFQRRLRQLDRPTTPQCEDS